MSKKELVPKKSKIKKNSAAKIISKKKTSKIASPAKTIDNLNLKTPNKPPASSSRLQNLKREKFPISVAGGNIQGVFDIEKALIENFIALQKVMTNLSIKFDNLSTQISKLLELFEISAKSLAEKDFSEKGERDDKIIIEKLNNLIEQNKLLAKGLTLMHDRIPEKTVSQSAVSRESSATQRGALPEAESEEYQKSVSSNPSKFPPLPKK